MNKRLIGIGALLVILVPLIAWAVAAGGWETGLAIVGGLAFIAATAWYPPSVVRVLGSAYLGGFVALIARHAIPCGARWGFEGVAAWAAAGVIGALIGVLSWWRVPRLAQRKFCFVVPSMVFLVYMTTLLMYAAPGSPFAGERTVSTNVLEAKASKFKVYDDPNRFFLGYMQDLVVDGSLGLSAKSEGRTVNQLLVPAMPVSGALGILALTLAVTIGLVLGVRAGLRPNSVADYSSMGLALIGITLPNFVIGALLLIVFSLHLGWFPVGGWGSLGHLVLPAITLALPYAAYIARLARGGTIEVMRQDYIRTARAKGLPEKVVVLKHALKGAILPVVSFLGPAAAGIMTGSFVVERLFGIPGIGQFFVKGAINRDYSLVLGTALLYFTVITLFNMIVDLAYSWLDPRTRTEAA